ncbi:IclR family transcriptional regulator [Ramlibacter sp.]|uniref:IclR family transcriptional regulator n=1 Tax=Ramlibacter sp. TaxID=1917967 RepID=UPI002D634B4C|nr:IclR family transcriptional regulator [Ramlibacter sp.]HYD76452.1 IclR family transcriptional regulator [Ramlibacter sp.]
MKSVITRDDPPAAGKQERNRDKPRRGIQSVETGSLLLRVLAGHVAPMHLRELAGAAGIAAGKAHPYLVSFLKVGFVVQDAAGRYELGPLALQIGLSKLQRLDPVKAAAPLVEQLAEETGQSIALAVWGTFGPTIVRLDEPVQPMHVNLRAGSVMALSNTATGRLFAAYMPPKVIAFAREHDLLLQGPHAEPQSRRQFEALVEETRRHRLSRTIGQPIAGIDAFCAPVFDSTGTLVLGITAMGPSASFDSAWDGRVATALRRCAEQVSARLGYVVA